MPFQSQKKPLELSEEQSKQLQRTARSRTESVRRVERARILLAYARGETVSAIARKVGTNQPKVNRCIDKALGLGVEAALSDLPGRGRKRLIGCPARAWLVSLACRKPKELGYAQELWTTHLLAGYAAATAGGPSIRVWRKSGAARSRRYSRQRHSNPTKYAITWKNGIRTLMSRWPEYCVFTSRSRCCAKRVSPKANP